MIEDQPEQAAVMSQPSGDVLLLKKQIADLTEQLSLLTTSREHQRPIVYCFYCNQLIHIQHQCQAYQSQLRQQPHHCYTCGKVGHLERDCRQHQGILK